MSIKGGDLLTVGNQIVVDRAQTAGPGTVNLNRTKVYELGNYLSVGSVVDLPDTSWTCESLDASAEFEAMLCQKTFFTGPNLVTGTATAGSTTTVTDGAKTWVTNEWAGGFVKITGGTGSGQTRTIASNTATVLTVTAVFTTAPDNTSVYSVVRNNVMKLAQALPIDVASEFKAGASATAPFDIVGSVSVPYLNLESMSYRFGLADNAAQTATLKGDLVFYNKGSAYIEETAGSNTANQVVPLAHTAYPYTDPVAGVRYAQSISLSTGARLTYGSDYTEAVSGGGQAKTVSVTILAAVPTTSKIRIIYASPTVANYPQATHAVASATRPAAIRGRNIEVYIGGHLISNRWTSVQSVQLDWKVTLQRDEEFSNSAIVSQDYDVPDVSGNIVLKPRDYAELYSKVRQIANVTDGEAVGPLTTTPLSLDIVLNSDVDGTPLKTLSVPDARFNLPGFSGRVQQKTEVTFDWTSDTGDCSVSQGRPF